MAEWSKEEVAKVRLLAALGMSGSEIGRQIGRSRSAVGGLCYRELIPLRGDRRGRARAVIAERADASPAELVLLKNGIGSEKEAVRDGERDPELIEAVIAELRSCLA